MALAIEVLAGAAASDSPQFAHPAVRRVTLGDAGKIAVLIIAKRQPLGGP